MRANEKRRMRERDGEKEKRARKREGTTDDMQQVNKLQIQTPNAAPLQNSVR